MNENIEISIPSPNTSQKPDELLRFPKIQRIPSRGVQKQVKSSTRLPSIKMEPIEAKREERSQRILGSSQQDFVGEVERKIKMVLEEQHIQQLEESQQSDQDNFEKKIIQNKEIIKKVKRKNQRLKKENAHVNNAKIQSNLARKISQPNKHEIHQKRIRQYKQGSIENLLQKKKDLFINLSKQKQTNELKEARNLNGALKQFVSNKQISMREVKSKEDLTPFNKISNNNKHQLNSAAQPRKLNKQLSHKILSPLQKNEQLFDAIHNYLQNPKRHDIEAVQPFKLGKQKEQLQKKLRWYEEKINASACEERPIKNKFSVDEIEESNKSDIKMMTSSQWSKIKVNNGGLFAQQNSSFDKQMDRINRYLQRNEQSLEKYVLNQKMLVDVNLICRKHSENK